MLEIEFIFIILQKNHLEIFLQNLVTKMHYKAIPFFLLLMIVSKIYGLVQTMAYQNTIIKQKTLKLTNKYRVIKTHYQTM